MKMEEYLSTVTDQIRCRMAREMVSEELKSHILDQAEAYEAEGMFEDDALEKAVREMGDPVETGVSLDRVHRPQMAWSMMLLVGIISVLGIAIHVVLGMQYPEDTRLGMWFVSRYVGPVVLGYAAMLLVYRLDYSILGACAKWTAAGFLTLMIGLSCFTGAGIMINGALLYLRLGAFSFMIPMVMYLYAPIYGALLYHYRGGGYEVLWKLLPWTAIPLLFLAKLPSLTSFLTLGVVMLGLFSVAVSKGWYQMNRKRVLIGAWLCILCLPVLLTGAWWLTGNLAEYQMARIRAFWSGGETSYLEEMIHSLLGESRMIGGSGALSGGPEMFRDLWAELNSDFMLVYVISAYGILAGLLVVGLLVGLTVKIFRISMGQRNQLGMIVGCSCGMVILAQAVLHLAVNLGIAPATSSMLPLLSAGGTGNVVFYILLGLVLSIYRYKNILPKKRKRWSVRIISS
ncbi:MAG: FtsW/RodA/SpoVE family cell cycle protein [Clostridiales bacterium]|nr:FtsW/RodA/SpoVE family cell cycle protein [Clostridiales bacterium]